MIPILLGTHEYEWAIRIFAELFAKYYGDEEIIYFGDRENDLPFNIKFQQVPCFSDGVWDWENSFGEGLKSICYSHLDEILLIFLPDHWLNRKVNKSVIYSLAKYMDDKHKEVVRVNLTDDVSWHTGEVESVEHWQELEIVEVKPWSIHSSYNGGFTFCPSLWNPQLLGRSIESRWDLWNCEKLGTELVRALYPKMKVVGSNPAALERVHGLFHSSKRVSINGLSDEDKKIVLQYLPEGYAIC
jgi:hypothetical protein